MLSSFCDGQMPNPDETAMQHSQLLKRHIGDAVFQQGGWISFAKYMDLSLYAPNLGYYCSSSEKFGVGGDFVTAPEISELFSRCLARQIGEIVEQTSGDILELGGGSGKMAAEILLALEKSDQKPRAYYILDLSLGLMELQKANIQQKAPHLFDSVKWIRSLPSKIDGVVLGNEILDAVPVNMIEWRDNQIFERGVSCENSDFLWEKRPASGELYERATNLGIQERQYVSEIGLQAEGLVRSLSSLIERGVLIFVDYGFGQAEYYHPQRNKGTLMCHYRHFGHTDPFFYPGLQDITSHVNFTSVARAAEESGLVLCGYCNQAQFLINCGITDMLEGLIYSEKNTDYLLHSGAAQKLLSPAEMGEIFKVIGFSRGLKIDLLGFSNGNKERML